MTINVSGKKALECIFMAKGLQSVPVDVVIAICNDNYNFGVIEFTRLTKERICNKVNIRVDMLNKYIKRLVDNDVLTPMGNRGAYLLSADWILELSDCNFDVSLSLSTVAENTQTATYRQGVLVYDPGQERYTIMSDDMTTTIHSGLHCGECFEVYYKDSWIPTRIEMRHTKAKEQAWYLVDIKAKRKLDNLQVRIPA